MSGVTMRVVQADDDGVRLDRWFRNHFPDLGHGQLQKLLRKGQIRLDGKRVKAGDRVVAGQEVRVPPLPVAKATRQPRPRAPVPAQAVDDLKQRILYQDDAILALNKPAGLAVQGGSKVSVHLDGMLDGLRMGAKTRPQLVHRLDKDTSGVLVLARTPAAARALTQQFRRRETRKLYWALVAGVPELAQGVINMRLGKLPGRGGEKVHASDRGKSAETVYEVVDQAGRKAAWLAMEPRTGRTHQLRAHAALALETPIIGDGKYGGKAAYPDGIPVSDGMLLHARAIRLARPAGRPILIEAPPPAAMRETFKFLGFDPGDPAGGFLDEADEF